jgi:hypothetical protein
MKILQIKLTSSILLLVLLLLIRFQGENSFITAIATSKTPPVTVAIESWPITTLEAFQRKTFFAHNKYWVFWGEAEMRYKTSTDGLTWSTANYVCPGAAASFSLWFDGTFIHYVRSTGIPTESLIYRRGIPNPNGTITWSTPDEQTVLSTTLQFHEPFIAVDSEGYPWIGYRWGTDGDRWPNCTKSSLNNGTWQTAPGFPYRLSPFSIPNWAVSIVPLTQQKVYAVYLSLGIPGSLGAVRGKLWNGTAFENEELIAPATISGRTRFAHSVVAMENNVYLVFLNLTITSKILFLTRTYGVGWSAPETIQSAVASTAFPVLSIDLSNGGLTCFWADNDVIYYKQCVKGLWDSSATTLATEVNLREDSLSCSYQTWGSRIEVIWNNGTIDNCNIRFCSLLTGTICKLMVTSSTGGTTNPTPGPHDYVEGSPVDVAAISNSGYSFGYWLLDGENRTENPITVIMNVNHTLEAFFVDNIQPEISTPMQEPPENVMEHQNVTITVNVTDLGTGVYNVTLWYNINSTATWMPLNMTKISLNTYQAMIPGYGNSTLIKYKIIAYDNVGNEAVKNNEGQYYAYHVIPEFSSILILPLFVIATLLAVIFYRKKKFI